MRRLTFPLAAVLAAASVDGQAWLVICDGGDDVANAEVRAPRTHR